MATIGQQEAWSFYGELLKDYREAAGLTQRQLAGQASVSGTYIGLFEQGIRKPQLDVSVRIDEALKTGDLFERTWRRLINKAGFASYFQPAAELEAISTRLFEFSPLLVPGLLQTAGYARALTTAGHPLASEEYIEDSVAARVDRARILKGPTSPELWVVLHENTILTPVGGPAGMAEQLEHIATLARDRTALVTVIPRSVGAHASMSSMLRLMEFEDQPTAAYTETSFSGTLIEDPSVVKRAQYAYDLLKVSTLPPAASLALIESTAENFRRCASTT
ncbi:Scr1 family TA system antitoxin-like transcriptional regulator [Streptomyces sp. NPDC056144]|uniref:helix-turn-helix domain-containing protein n=1 Tax=unclassified Streptomyces TaxID=2593676 RepID=UPI0035DD92B2